MRKQKIEISEATANVLYSIYVDITNYHLENERWGGAGYKALYEAEAIMKLLKQTDFVLTYMGTE